MTSDKKTPIRFTDRFGWFWYNDPEIFFDTQEDLDAKMKAMHDQGITHVITFSCTHFRWSFRPWWDKINECLKRICIAAHKYDIKVIEHHSAHLDHFLPDQQKTERFIRHFRDRGGDVANYPGLIKFLKRDDPEEAERYQINGQTGVPVSPYDAHGHCFNNPDYVRDYLAYLESVYAAGPDGIMTDDVQYYGLGMACSCAVCREKFRQETGLELPPDGDHDAWEAWTKDMRNPGFIQWQRFRVKSVLDFHRKVAEHYHRLGLSLLRPNYSSSGLGGPSLSVYAMDALPELDVIFQECCLSSVIRYSFLSFLDEQQHRALLGRKRSIPHMMMFYADTPNKLTFVWGVARLAGAMLTNTFEGGGAPDETLLRKFDIRYEKKLFGLAPLAEVGFLDSREDAQVGPNRSLSRFRLWMQSCRLHNIQHTLLDIRDPASWQTPVLILNETGMMRDSEIADLEKWMQNGGTLIVSGQCGVVDEMMRMRPLPARADLETADLAAHEVRIETRGKGRLVRVGCAFGYPGSDEENRKLFIDNPDRFDFRYIIQHIRRLEYMADCYDDRNTPSAARPGERFARGAAPRAEVAKLIRSLGVPARCTVEGLPEGVLYTVYDDGADGLVLHLLNSCQCLEIAPDAVPSHRDPIPFPALSGEARIRLDAEGRYTAKLITLAGETLLALAPDLVMIYGRAPTSDLQQQLTLN